MSFGAPLFLAFVALVGVPIAVHLIGRSRAERRPFAALALLLASERKTAQRTTLRRWALLALRALAIVAVPLVLARPFLERHSDLPVALGADESAVLIVDDTLSMQRKLPDGDTLFERARGRAERLVEGLAPTAEAALLVATRSETGPVGELTSDRERLRKAAHALKPTARAADLGPALKRAAQLLGSATRPRHRVYVLSDLSTASIPAEAPWAAGTGPEVVLVDANEDAPRRNRAVVELAAEPAAELGPRAVAITATVASWGAALTALPVTLRVDGQPVQKGLVDVPADGRADKKFVHVFPARRDEAGGGVHVVEVQLGPDPADGLALDDTRLVRVTVEPPVRALLVDGDPRTVRREDELFYLETALRPVAHGPAEVQVTTVGVDELAAMAGERALPADVVFLCNVKAPEPGAPWPQALQRFVEAGGGLFISAGDNVDPDAWNATLGPLLPQPLQAVRQAGASRRPGDGEGGSREATPSGAGERITRVERAHPALSALVASTPTGAAGVPEGFETARFDRLMLVRPVARGTDDDHAVLLGLGSGAPLLLARPLGRGRVLFYGSTVDRDWTDLPIQPVFLPLVRELTRYLAGRGTLAAGAAAPVLVGERREVAIPADVADGGRVEVRPPGLDGRVFSGEALRGRRAVSFLDTETPGAYHVLAGTGALPATDRADQLFVVDVDARESDPRKAPPDALARLTQGAAPAGGKPADKPVRKVELWHGLGAALLLFLLLEAILLARGARLDGR